MKLNLALTIPQAVSVKAVELSKQLSEKYDAYFVLGEDNYPHITVYAVNFPDVALKSVLDAAARIAATSQALQCTYKQVKTHQGYIGVAVVRSEEMMRFHGRVISALAPLRSDQHAGGKEYAMSFTEEQMAYIQLYGYADAMQLYNPHFTLTRLMSEQQANQAVAEIKWDIPEFVVRSFGIYITGNHGTCIEQIKEFMIA